MTDYSRIAERHKDINLRLERWGRWITKTGQGGRTHPMFAQYRSHAWQWEAPEIHVPGTPGENLEIERLVSSLPENHRTATRWAYAFPWVPVSIVRHALGLTRAGLAEMLDEARDMLNNRMKYSCEA